MTAIDLSNLPANDRDLRTSRREKLYRVIGRCDPWFKVLGLAWITPIWRAAAGDDPRGQVREIWRLAVVPVLAIAGFLALWASLAPLVQTSLGAIPGPAQVWEQVDVLRADAAAEAQKERAFYLRQSAKNAELVAAGKASAVKDRSRRALLEHPDYYTNGRFK